jgi:glycosyltransferase involved in cell wall biosynthesis
MEAVNNLLDSYPDRKCDVYLLHGNMSDEELAGLYNDKTVNAYLSTSHGEGFGLPIFEACGYGLPIIAPNWSGYTDFTTTKSGKSAIMDIDYELREVQDQAVWEGVIEKDSEWCFVNLANVRTRMRELYNDSETYKKQATKLKNSIRKKYTIKKQYKQFIKSIREVL